MKIGSKVLYHDEEWEVLFVYDNADCEIKRWGSFVASHIELVQQSDLIEVK